MVVHFRRNDATCATRAGGTGFALLACIAALGLGCSGAPSAIEPVDFNPGQASAGAMESYDKDQDGCLNDEEMAAVPGVLKYKDKYDADGNGCVSEAEMAARIESWSDQGVGIRTLLIEVQLEGKPLPGAEVTMTPEVYLGEGPKPATGTTDAGGKAKMSVAPEVLPEDLRKARIRGVFAGTYRIAVSHPRVDLPDRYREGTALGDEIARDTVGDRILIELTRK